MLSWVKRGLALKRLADWNKATVIKHIWNLFTQSDSLRVAWTHACLLKGRCFWTNKIPQDSSWDGELSLNSGVKQENSWGIRWGMETRSYSLIYGIQMEFYSKGAVIELMMLPVRLNLILHLFIKINFGFGGLQDQINWWKNKVNWNWLD